MVGGGGVFIRGVDLVTEPVPIVLSRRQRIEIELQGLANREEQALVKQGSDIVMIVQIRVHDRGIGHDIDRSTDDVTELIRLFFEVCGEGNLTVVVTTIDNPENDVVVFVICLEIDVPAHVGIEPAVIIGGSIQIIAILVCKIEVRNCPCRCESQIRPPARSRLWAAHIVAREKCRRPQLTVTKAGPEGFRQ